MKQLEKYIKEKIEEIDNEENSQEKNSEETEFKVENFDEFLKKTQSNVTVKKEGCMPSPIFGNRDMNPHNKYRISIENPRGKISYIFWDSIYNTQKNIPLDKNNALASFGMDVEAFREGPSFEEFKSIFGYNEAEEELAQRAYNGCRKQMEKAEKIFTEVQLDELIRLASEW